MALDNQGIERVLNWVPSPPDPRDYRFADHMPFAARLAETPEALPLNIDLDPGFPNPLTDQGQTGECTAHGSLNDFEYVLKLLGYQTPLLSHKAQYILTRLQGGFPANQDTGAYVRDTVKVLSSIGAVLAAMHSDSNNFAVYPTSLAIADASKRTALKYVSVPVDVNAVKASLAAGFPVIIGFRVPQAFMGVGADGLVPANMTLIPNAGHCVIVTGYDERPGSLTFGRFKIRNSWGTGWGAQGRAWIHYSWLMALGADFWAITDVKGERAIEPVPPPAPKVIKVLTQPQDAFVGFLGGGFSVQVDPGVVVTAQIRNTVGKLYGGPVIVRAAENGVAQFGGIYISNPHTGTDALVWGLTAPGFEPTMTNVFKVTSPVVPPVPPVPPAPSRVITGILTEFHDGDKVKFTLAYSDHTGKVVEA